MAGSGTAHLRPLDEVLLRPSILHGEFTPDLTAELFGQRHVRPQLGRFLGR